MISSAILFLFTRKFYFLEITFCGNFTRKYEVNIHLRLYAIKILTPTRRKTSVVITASISSEPSAINNSAVFLDIFAVYLTLFKYETIGLQTDCAKVGKTRRNIDMYN